MQAPLEIHNYQTGYIAAANLFTMQQVLCCTGIMVHAGEEAACKDTARLSNMLAKNQWFRVLIPPTHTFLSLDDPIKKQYSYVIEHLCAQEALSVIYISEGRHFLHKLNDYLESIGAQDDPEAARTEVAEFYTEKRRAVLDMDAKAYLAFILEKSAAREKAAVSSYLYHFGISGLAFSSPSAGKSFLLFNPRRDSIIKEIKRAVLDDSRLVS
jgi:hypothetical protein